MTEECLKLRVYGEDDKPTVIYLPGLHGDWTLITSFRLALEGKARFVEFTYPRTLEWSVEKYAEEIDRLLLDNGIQEGWVVGESFGSQVGWALLDRLESHSPSFRSRGYILANGFDKYPFLPGVWLVRWILGHTPPGAARLFMWAYRKYAFFRHRHAPETFESTTEFFARRNRMDVEAMRHRLWLIATFDPRPMIQRTHVPVYFLAGVIDPIVPWIWSRRWIQKNCASYVAHHTILLADHNVLSTQPKLCADKIMQWMREAY